MKRKAICPLILLLLLLLFANGCQWNLLPSDNNNSLSYTQTSEFLATITSPLHSPLSSATFAKTTIPTATVSPTVAFSMTPFPTLSDTESVELVNDLLKNNGGCSLPCWWGFTPGETTWNDARQFLATFATRFEQGNTVQITEGGEIYQSTDFTVFYDTPNVSGGDAVRINLRNGIISSIVVFNNSTIQSFQLQQLLAEYGQPEKVYISTFQNVPDFFSPFYLVLYYPEYQFLATFYTDVPNEGENRISCPQSESPILNIWGANEIVTYQDIEMWVLGIDPTSPLRELDKVTNMSIEEFYNTFVNFENSECIKTPAKYWP